jgi:hypothetical protein
LTQFEAQALFRLEPAAFSELPRLLNPAQLRGGGRQLRLGLGA